METQNQKCLTCNFTDGKYLNVEEMMFGINQNFNYLLCANCETLTLIDPPENLNDFYPSKYYSFSNPKKSRLRLFLRKKKDKFTVGYFDFIGMLLGVFSFPESNLKALKMCKTSEKSSKILDVGCGGGTLLNRLQSLGFNNLYGIDPFIDRDENLKNIQIEKKTIQDINSESKRYDIIIFSHVLEHIQSPVQELTYAKNSLESEGKIILRIPISSSYAFKKYNQHWFQIDAPRHYFVPTFQGLVCLFDQVGLEIQDYFYDSRPNQIIASKGYVEGIPLVNQFKNKFFSKVKNVYYSIHAKYLNWSKKGDQAVFILKARKNSPIS